MQLTQGNLKWWELLPLLVQDLAAPAPTPTVVAKWAAVRLAPPHLQPRAEGVELGLPLTALTATRLGLPDRAVDALLTQVQPNTYLPNGHNYQEGCLPLYLPGNGGLLAAVALMCAGYDGCQKPNPGLPPGLPKDWKVKWEGLQKML